MCVVFSGFPIHLGSKGNQKAHNHGSALFDTYKPFEDVFSGVQREVPHLT